MNTKMVIVWRHDLKFRLGKKMAQAGHAALTPFRDRLLNGGSLTEVEKHWLAEFQKKVTLRVNSEEELLEIYEKAKLAGLTTHLITDAGFTETHGVPTLTCISIGPDESTKIDLITGHLELL
jgi:PTH2 family peptidyl-tRNA hydrolase